MEKVKVYNFKAIDFFPEEVFHLPVPAGLFNRLIGEKLLVVKERCTNCGTCIEVCSSRAIDKGKNSVKINYDKCIRCFCCAEFCPEKAIRVRRNPLFLFFHKLLQKINIPW